MARSAIRERLPAAANGTLPARGTPGAGRPAHALLDLQRQVGNRAVGSVIQPARKPIDGVVQRKLTVGHGLAQKTYTSSTDLKKDRARVIDEIKFRRTGKVRAVWRVLKDWADDGKHNFHSWGQAVDDALEVVKNNERRKRDKSPERPMSPYTGFQQEELDHLEGDGRKDEHMKDGAVWNELKIHGQLGEHGHRRKLRKDKVRHRDANQSLGYNAPGIDTLIDRGRPFGQSKMHIAEGLSLEAVAEAYVSHVKLAPDYARTLLSRLLLDSTSGGKMRTNLRKLAGEWKNDVLNKLVVYLDDEAWIQPKSDLMELLEPSVLESGELEHAEPVKIISDAMIFPVPSDVYAYLLDHHAEIISFFEPLEGTLYDYRKIKAGMRFRPNKREKTEEEKDPNFGE